MDLSEIDPAYYQRTYWLAPDGEEAARAYRLLVAAMEDRGKAGIGMVVMRNQQYLAAIRARDGALAMSTMRFSDEIVDRKQIEAIPGRTTTPDAKEVRLATQIIDSLAGAWKPDRYHDTYAEEVRKLIKAHENGHDVVMEEAPAERAAEVVDLMAALEASVEAARSRKGRGKALSDAAKKSSGRRPAKKQASKASSKGDADSQRRSA